MFCGSNTVNRGDGGKSQGPRGEESTGLSLRENEALQVTPWECGPDHALEGKRSQSKRIVFLLFYVAVIVPLQKQFKGARIYLAYSSRLQPISIRKLGQQELETAVSHISSQAQRAMDWCVHSSAWLHFFIFYIFQVSFSREWNYPQWLGPPSQLT